MDLLVKIGMKNEYTAVIKQENDWWIGWIEEVPGGRIARNTPVKNCWKHCGLL